MDGLSVPNGKGFTLDFKQMYFVDSDPHEIYLFDYDQETGSLSNQRVFAAFAQDDGFPDGMTTDADGYIWTAVWFGGRLARFAPDGRLDREIHLPVRQVSAVAFAGENLDEIYVTTAASDIADAMGPPDFDTTLPRGGGLYRVRLAGIRGVAPFRSRIRFS
jgi:sugar lactone lactonase YvrE